MDNIEIVIGLVNFSVVAVIVLVSVAMLFSVFCKKFKFKEKNIEVYGLLMNLDTVSLISISALTICYLFLVWCTISFTGLNIIYITFITILVIISDVVIDNFNKLPISLLLTVVDCVAIQVIYLIYNYLTKTEFSYFLLIILILVIIFVFLYYTYNFFRQINNIVVRNKYLKDKQYKI